jgi:radical SAM-linked protein
VRHLPRIFRRAGFELAYSIGFHPKPELSFGPALGLGIPSLGEILDAKLVGDVEPAELVRRLARVSLEGVEFLEAAALGDADRALGRVIAEAEFAVRLPAGADLGAALERVGGDAPLVIRRESERQIARTVDVRRSLRRFERFDDAEVRRRLGWPDGELAAFRVGVSHEGSARPAEVVAVLFGEAVAADVELARLGLHAEDDGDPLRIDELRTASQAGDRRVRSEAASVAPAS